MGQPRVLGALAAATASLFVMSAAHAQARRPRTQIQPQPTATVAQPSANAANPQSTAASGAAPVAQSTASAGPSPLRIAASQGVDGAFAAPSCVVAPPAADLATRSAAIRAAVNDGALAIDTGSFLGVAAIGQMAVSHDADGLAAAVRSAGFSALSLARRDLAASRETLVRAARSLRAAGVPYVLSNLACEPRASEVCEAIVDASDPAHIVTIHGQRVAIISAVHPSALDHVARDRADGISLQDPAPALTRAVRAARNAGAQRVVAVYDPRREDSLDDALAVARDIPPADAPDVLLVNGISNAVQRALAGEHGRMHIVATRATGVTRVDVLEDTVRTSAGQGSVAVSEAQRYEQSVSATICREEARRLQGASLRGTLDAQGLVGMLADVLRHYARADVSIVNYGVVDRRHYHALQGQLRRVDVLLAIPFDNTIRLTRVKGSVLKAAFTAAARQRFVFRGLELDGSAIRVNGRALEDDAEYTVSATDFVADAHVLGADVEWSAFGTRTARESLLRYLDIPRARDPRLDADDPSRHTRWTFRLAVNGALSAVQLSNPATSIITDAQLTRSQAISANINADGRINADHPDFTWENTLTAKYGFVRTLEAMMDPMMMASPINETADLLSLRSVFAWRGLRSRVPRWYVPSPYAELYAESEFTKPDARAFHHFELRPTGGARFQVNDRFSVFFGYGASGEVLARREDLPPGQLPVVSTFQLGWVLQPGTLVTIAGRDVQWDSTLDVAMRDVFRLPGIQLRGHLGLSFPLVGPLSLTIGYDVFVRYLAFERNAQGQTNAFGFANDVEVGLGFNWARALQTFSR
ncbi:MAG: 5'-nucleotidase C-terminal domain-containing protein [Polyangiales bacterium]